MNKHDCEWSDCENGARVTEEHETINVNERSLATRLSRVGVRDTEGNWKHGMRQMSKNHGVQAKRNRQIPV